MTIEITEVDREAAERFDRDLSARLTGTQLHNLAAALTAHRIAAETATEARIAEDRSPLMQEGYRLGLVEGARMGIEAALDCRPSTAENPEESAYQSGRFRGVMDFSIAIHALDPRAIVERRSEPPERKG